MRPFEAANYLRASRLAGFFREIGLLMLIDSLDPGLGLLRFGSSMR